jgi:hypothetical protein
MAEISSYPKIQPKAQDLLLGSRTYVAGVDEFTGNPTSVFTVKGIVDLVSVEAAGVSGTVGKIPVFTTATTVGDSIITQNTNGGLDVNGNVTSTYNAADTNAGAYDISRTLSALTANARGYRDNTIITSPGNNAVSYAGIDLKSQSTNGTYGHVTMLQGRHSLDAANLTDFEGIYIGGLSFANSSSAVNYVGVTVENPTLFNGSITNFIGTNIKAPSRSGGSITNFYGLKIEDNVSATNKWSVYSEDTSVKSKMLGQLDSGDISVYNTGTNASLYLNSSSTASGGNYIHAKKSDNSNQWVLGSNSASNDQVILKQYNEADIIFANNSGNAVTIVPNGDVGIGINIPSQKLHVDGSARVTGGYYDSSNSQGTSGQVLSSTGSGTSWVDNSGGNAGTVTSVDLSTDIGAFIVAANPITSAGTITLNLNGGTAGQFLRQDGNWADIPGGNAGTVTSVSGTGTVSGLTLTGTVTSSGDLTLGGTLALTSANVTTGLGFTPYNATNPAGYTAFAEPGIFSGGGTPTLATGVTALEVRTLIGAGTSSLTLGTTSTTALAGDTNTITAAQTTAIDDSVKNNTDTYAPSAKITQIVTLSLAQYQAISGGPLASTLYIIL